MTEKHENIANKAVALFKAGFNCSQAVCAAFVEQCGLNEELALKVAGGFGGGMGRSGEICGALSGAVIIIGLKHGPVKADDKTARMKTYGLVRELFRKFKSRNNNYMHCRDLIGCDISTPEGFKRAMDERIIPSRCPKFIRDAAEILEEII